MNVQQRIDELLAYTNVTTAGVVGTPEDVPALSIRVVKVQYVYAISDIEHHVRTCDLIVYNYGEANEDAVYYRQIPNFLRRDTYHTDEQVKNHIEATYVGAVVINIRQVVIGETDRIAVDAKWTDGLYYTAYYRAWGPSLFAEEKIEQMQ